MDDDDLTCDPRVTPVAGSHMWGTPVTLPCTHSCTNTTNFLHQNHQFLQHALLM